ncbi:mannose-1-phosphate guanylyltransferase [Cognataquiflexum rubidum]|uniref:mannose-1-phosphate guanylyltransferase n=1 Tax=Cognataquiflexum rubidum TaxID=2922273 RepID=UPI001F133B1D|nr:sugar phosphate nucleotidyltransferase [Cognataquiflexum rubidum]MCH6234055.1 NTP transferase domain-containing protein [Cognataquiflexum rubidum]
MKTIHVILSGGVGSRLWPLSRKSRPKQYLPLFDNKSLFELAVERNKLVCDELYVVGGIDNYQLSREILAHLGISHYQEIVEACPRNTAAAIAFAAFEADPEDILLVTPSDHLIENETLYLKAVDAAVALAKSNFIVTFGLPPKNPETGFGYIEYDVNEVISFREKPSKVMAETFVNSGNFLWNSGMFCFKAGVFLDELKNYQPEVYAASKTVFFKKNGIYLNELLSMEIPSISVDYAVMEKTKKIKVVPSYFEWSDMGSFLAIYDQIPEHDIRKSGSNLPLNTKKLVEFVGVENLILVETEDAILVLNKNNAQDVKKVYERLEKENPEYLK